jgi:hypothetical protein
MSLTDVAIEAEFVCKFDPVLDCSLYRLFLVKAESGLGDVFYIYGELNEALKEKTDSITFSSQYSDSYVLTENIANSLLISEEKNQNESSTQKDSSKNENKANDKEKDEEESQATLVKFSNSLLRVNYDEKSEDMQNIGFVPHIRRANFL